MTSPPTCQTCIYFVANPPADPENPPDKATLAAHGTCHREPPGLHGTFPWVREGDWCGQHDRFTKWWLEKKA